VLSTEDFELLTGAVDTFTALTRELQLKGVTLGAAQAAVSAALEKTSKVLGGDGEASEEEEEKTKSGAPEADDTEKKKSKGHGRNSAAAYTGAKREKVLTRLCNGGDGCPGCATGKVYPMKEPALLLRVHGGGAARRDGVGVRPAALQRLRRGVHTHPRGRRRHREVDESADAMVAMLRYGVRRALNRIERLQAGMGIPLPASTQWESWSGASMR